MTKICKKCETEFNGPDDPALCSLLRLCPKCLADQQEAAAKEEAERRLQEREKRWRGLCPPSYRETVIEKLPNPDKAEEVLSWTYGPTG